MPDQLLGGSILDRIKRLAELLSQNDNLPRERRRTARIFDRCFGPKTSWQCGVCGRSMPQVPDMGRAHIVALEEGGTTHEDNLIPLCEGSTRVSTALAVALDWHSEQSAAKPISFREALTQSSSTKSDELGCHKLLDSGLISRVTIRQIRGNRPGWGRYKDVRDSVFDTPMASLATEFSPTSARARGITRLREQVADLKHGTDEWFRAHCKLISAARRLADPQFLSLAQDCTAELERLKSSRISKEALSLFYYEKALVLMVQQPEPDLRGAILALERSCALAREANDDRGFAMSRLEWVHAKTFASSKMTPRGYENLAAEEERAKQLLGYKGEPRTADEMRWTMNYLMHRAQLQIKARRTAEAKESLSRARALRENLTVPSGWTLFQAVHLNTIEGAVLALEGDYDNALRLLARALIPMKAARGKRPEGYLDVGRCAAWVVEQQRRPVDAREIRNVIRQMRDGRSGFWPFE